MSPPSARAGLLHSWFLAKAISAEPGGAPAPRRARALPPGTEEGRLGIVAFDTGTFRELAAALVRPTDCVLEIGCSYGRCTAILARAAGDPRRVVGVDTSKEASSGASNEHGRGGAKPWIPLAHHQDSTFCCGAPALASARCVRGSPLLLLWRFAAAPRRARRRPQVLAAARAELPHLVLKRGDALASPLAVSKLARDLLLASDRPRADAAGAGTGGVAAGGKAASDLVVFVDIGGNRELEALAALLPW